MCFLSEKPLRGEFSNRTNHLRRRLQTIAGFCTIWLTLSAAFAQSVRWEAPMETIVGQSFEVSLVFENCSPKTTFRIPTIDGLELRQLGENRQITMNNGVVTSRLNYTYIAVATRADRIVLPAFTVDTTDGLKLVPELPLVARAASGQAPGSPQQGASRLQQIIDANIITELMTTSDEVWVGQVFPLTYRLLVNPRQQVQLRGRMNWPATGWIVEPWDEARQDETFHLGRYWVSLTQSTFAMTEVPGERVLEPATLDVLITTGRRNTWPFPQNIQEEATLSTEPKILRVKPLPAGAPAGFTGAVGQFNVTVDARPREVSAGEPVTWTLTISGLGNWPSNFTTPKREPPAGWRVIGPDLKRESEPGRLFQASVTEEAILVPDRAGDFTLPGVQFSWFDPQAGEYRTFQSEPIVITVKPGRVQQPQLPSSVPADVPAQRDSARSVPARPLDPPVVTSEPELLREPLPGITIVSAPLAANTLRGAVFLPWLLLPVVIYLLGRKRALALDPNLPRRQAIKELSEAVARAQSLEGRADRSVCLQRWRRAAAVYFGVTQAAPTLEDFEVSQFFRALTEADRQRWLELIRGADEFLYGGNPTLPRTWFTHAEEQIKRLVAPRLGPLVGWEPRYWLARPAALMTVLVAGVCLSWALSDLVGDTISESDSYSLNAQSDQTAGLDRQLSQTSTVSRPAPDEAIAAYNAGIWDRAEELWRERLSSNPRDWKAHNNIALALAQQGFWGEASAHMLAARLLAPREADPAWNGAVIARKLDALTAEQSHWLLPARRKLPAASLSAFDWQILLIVASGILVFSIGMGLVLRQKKNASRWQSAAVATLVLGAIVIATVSVVAASQWGTLADPALVIFRQESSLRSLPTEVDKQISRNTRAGHVAVVSGSFLRWCKVRLPNGEIGWALKDSLLPVYRQLPES